MAQSALIRSERSSLWPIFCDVSHDSVLSPLLFNIYMKLVTDIIHHQRLRYHLHHSDPSNTVAALFWCIETVVGLWGGDNRLRLKPSKSEWLWMHVASRFRTLTTLILDGVALPQIDPICNLGVSWRCDSCSQSRWLSQHNFVLCTSCGLSWIGIPTLSHSNLGHLTFGLLQCTVHGLLLKGIQKLQLEQNGGLSSSWGP